MPKKPARSRTTGAFAPAPSHADFVEFGRDSMAAAMSSNSVLSAGIEALGQELALYTQSALQSAGETARGLLGARTFEDVVRLQTDFAQRSLESFVQRSSKLSELGYALIGASLGAWGQRAKG